MHGDAVGLVDDHKVLVLVDNPSAQCLGEHVGVDSLQLLREPHELLHPPRHGICGHLRGEEMQGTPGEEAPQQIWVSIGDVSLDEDSRAPRSLGYAAHPPHSPAGSPESCMLGVVVLPTHRPLGLLRLLLSSQFFGQSLGTKGRRGGSRSRAKGLGSKSADTPKTLPGAPAPRAQHTTPGRRHLAGGRGEPAPRDAAGASIGRALRSRGGGAGPGASHVGARRAECGCAGR